LVKYYYRRKSEYPGKTGVVFTSVTEEKSHSDKCIEQDSNASNRDARYTDSTLARQHPLEIFNNFTLPVCGSE
jgi:hypothetical protein